MESLSKPQRSGSPSPTSYRPAARRLNFFLHHPTSSLPNLPLRSSSRSTPDAPPPASSHKPSGLTLALAKAEPSPPTSPTPSETDPPPPPPMTRDRRAVQETQVDKRHWWLLKKKEVESKKGLAITV